MAQTRTGIKKILELEFFYSAFQRLIGGRKASHIIVNQFLKPFNKMKMLDIGCGPAKILDFISQDIDYLGLDFEKSYIASAQKKYGKRARFIQQNIGDFSLSETDKFDRIFMSGVMHHLDDNELKHILSISQKSLTKDGFFLALENVHSENSALIAKALIKMDRGQNVRTADGYTDICKQYFENVEHKIFYNLLHVPYTHIVIKCY